MDAALLEHGMNARTAVDPPMVEENLLDQSGKLGIFSAMLARLTVLPGIIAALGNIQGRAQQRDRVLLSVLRNERPF